MSSEAEIRSEFDRVHRDMEMVHDRLSAQGARITEVEKSHSINDVVIGNVDKRLSSIEDTLKWIVRLIVAAILMALLGLVLNGGSL